MNAEEIFILRVVQIESNNAKRLFVIINDNDYWLSIIETSRNKIVFTIDYNFLKEIGVIMNFSIIFLISIG